MTKKIDRFLAHLLSTNITFDMLISTFQNSVMRNLFIYRNCRGLALPYSYTRQPKNEANEAIQMVDQESIRQPKMKKIFRY